MHELQVSALQCEHDPKHSCMLLFSKAYAAAINGVIPTTL
jgi:hypothetical protein